jgi:hypothetical protein
MFNNKPDRKVWNNFIQQRIDQLQARSPEEWVVICDAHHNEIPLNVLAFANRRALNDPNVDEALKVMGHITHILAVIR